MQEKSSLLLIIPFYNEESRIAPDNFITAFAQFPNCTFLLVNDGSTDNTAIRLDELSSDHSNVKVLHLKANAGKAEAIRQAVLHNRDSSHNYIGYIDADLATPFSEIFKIEQYANTHPQFSFLMGSRIKKLGSTIVRYPYRHYLGRIFATIVSQFILKTPVYDTQCGAKIIKKELAVSLFEKPFITRWLFDIELLLRYKKQDEGYASFVYEYSLGIWIEQGKSKIRLKDFLGFPYQLIKIHYAHNKQA